MQFSSLHNRVLKLETKTNPHNWSQNYLVYVQFEQEIQAHTYAKNLLANFWCSDITVRRAKRFHEGYEIKIDGLLESKLKEIVSDLEAVDRYNGMVSESNYCDVDLRNYELEFQAVCDRQLLEQDWFDSACC